MTAANHYRLWRERKRREVFTEGATWPVSTRESARIYAWAAILRPRELAALAYARFKRRFPLPGDRFEDFQMDETYEIVGWRRGRLIAVATTGRGESREVACSKDWPLGRFLDPHERCTARWLPIRRGLLAGRSTHRTEETG